VDRSELLREYTNAEVSAETDSFVLYRIIGNDLYPRHAKGQSRENLRFILDNESPFEGCEKRFVVNRIIDPSEEERIIGLLDKHGYSWMRLPFNWKEYQALHWDIDGVPVQYAPYTKQFRRLSTNQKNRVMMRIYRHKNNYVINNNGARNAALREGRKFAKWVMPWDGNCFLTDRAWEEILSRICAQPEIPYHIVPMARITDNRDLLHPECYPPAEDEPQIVFRRDTELEFDSEYFYGRRPKVELLWRLGVPGNWDTWMVEPWDLPCPDYAEQAGCFEWAGWVARLFSGQKVLETNTELKTLIRRGTVRVTAVQRMLDDLDRKADHSGRSAQRDCFTSGEECKQRALEDKSLIEQLRLQAKEALQRGPFSVVDKTSLPPSGDRHDYWHPAPYYWPNPIPIPGLPYVRRDGRRVPGTRLYEAAGDQYDRTRLQRLFDDTFFMALAFRELDSQEYAEHGADLIRRWFLLPETAMNPHLEYAQVRRGHNGNRGSGRGIIEFKDMYYFLAAVRVIYESGALNLDEFGRFKNWLSQYLQWLANSPQGKDERAAPNNHGTCYDLQVASLASFLGDYDLVRRTFIDSRFRIIEQFDCRGRQPHELDRTVAAHYCCFNLQAWIHLADLAETCGTNLWEFVGPDGQSLKKAMQWLLSHMGEPWPYQQVVEFDEQRFYPIYYAYRARYGDPPGVDESAVPAMTDIKAVYFPHDGIQPFWQTRIRKMP
jgi:hypothetical protein